MALTLRLQKTGTLYCLHQAEGPWLCSQAKSRTRGSLHLAASPSSGQKKILNVITLSHVSFTRNEPDPSKRIPQRWNPGDHHGYRRRRFDVSRNHRRAYHCPFFRQQRFCLGECDRRLHGGSEPWICCRRKDRRKIAKTWQPGSYAFIFRINGSVDSMVRRGRLPSPA